VKTYLARLRTRVQNERGLVTLEYLAIAVLIIVVVTAIVAILNASIPTVQGLFDSIVSQLFAIR
jgi:Flp pilus assembly pilin Flp